MLLTPWLPRVHARLKSRISALTPLHSRRRASQRRRFPLTPVEALEDRTLLDAVPLYFNGQLKTRAGTSGDEGSGLEDMRPRL